MKTLYRLGIALYALAHFGTSHAEQWQEVQGREKFLTVAVNMASIRAASYEDMVSFELRADNHDDAIMTKQVLASCSEYSIEVEHEQIQSKQTAAIETLDWKHDSTLKQHPNYAQARLSFWGYTQAYGQAIKLACSQAHNRYSHDLEAFVQENCAMSNPLYKVACAEYPAWRANYKLYMARSHDTIFNCDISEERMTEQTSALLANVMRCKDESCGNQILETWINRRGADIATVVHMQDQLMPVPVAEHEPLCTSINEADKEIASKQSEEMFAKARYFGCLKRESAAVNLKLNPTAKSKNQLYLEQKVEKACAAHYDNWQKVIADNNALTASQALPETDADQLLFKQQQMN